MLLYTAYVLLLCYGPSGLVVRASDYYLEGFGRFKPQLITEFSLFWRQHLSQVELTDSFSERQKTILVTSPPHNFHVAQRQIIIIVSQRTKSELKCDVTDHTVSQSDKMAGQKSLTAQALECPMFPSAGMSSCSGIAP